MSPPFLQHKFTPPSVLLPYPFPTPQCYDAAWSLPLGDYSNRLEV